MGKDPSNRAPPPPDPHWPRYTSQPFPLYRHLPGRTPHPTRDPRGHSFGVVPGTRSRFEQERWAACPAYLHAIDLYNFGYWWECHEQLEELWNGVGREGDTAALLRALIQLAAANLKAQVDWSVAAQSLGRKSIAALRALGAGRRLGIDVPALVADATAYFAGERALPALIRLESSPPASPLR